MASETRRTGDEGEAIAVAYLEGKGYVIEARNVSFRVGELDVVARDGEQLVFVEVRSRRNGSGPRPEDTITLPKQRRLTRAAMLYLASHRRRECYARFDVVTVDVVRRQVQAHYVNAFEAAATWA